MTRFSLMRSAVVIAMVGLCSCFRLFGTDCPPGAVKICLCSDGRELEVLCPARCECDEDLPDADTTDGDAADGDAADGDAADGDAADGDSPPGPAARLAFSQEPSDGRAGQVISPAVSVVVLDDDGRRVRGASAEITLSLDVDPTGGAAALSGQGPVDAVEGLAVFPSLAIDTPGSGFVLRAAATSLERATSRPVSMVSDVPWPPEQADRPYRKRIVIPARSPIASLEGFPVLLSLEGDADLRDRAHAEGQDIRFTDAAGASAPHELERYDGGTGTLLCWVRLSTFDTSVDTVLFMYYGDPAAPAAPRDPSVWSSGYLAVWHLGETASGATGEYLDSTGLGHDATGGAGAPSATPSPQPGVIGTAQSGDGSEDFISTPLSLSGLSQASLSMWALVRDTTNTTRPGLVGQNNAVEMGFYWSDRINLWTPGMTEVCPGTGIAALCTTDFALDTWTHLAASWDGAEAILYVDGVERHRGPSAIGSSAFTMNLMGQVFDASGNTLDGALDEVRVADRERPAAWFALEHENQLDPSAFAVVGFEELRP